MTIGGSGTIAEIWRYPVKSMAGERVSTVLVWKKGLAGDRSFALVDRETGNMVSAKDYRRWPGILNFQATWIPMLPSRNLVRIKFPDSREMTSDQTEIEAALSEVLGRGVLISRNPPQHPMLRQAHPDLSQPANPDGVTTEKMLPGSFFDQATLHLVTSATLDTLAGCYPAGDFSTRRFRPNLVLDIPEPTHGFPENDWLGKTLCLGNTVRLRITGLCPRCVMTMLPQMNLGKDPGILKTAFDQNNANVGCLAEVLSEGTVNRGDPWWLDGKQ